MDTVVYQWLREDGSPYYIGIGKPQRPYTGRRSCGGPPPRDRIVVLHEGLEWEKACEIERELIAFYGRKDLGTGILRNLTNGGEGVRGLVVSEETRAKLSKARLGKKHSEEHRKNLSKASRGRVVSEETRKKISKAKSGENHHLYGKTGESHPMYGKKHTKEAKEKMSEKRSGKNNPKYTPRDWYHPVHGEVLQKSLFELIKMFPEQNLNPGHLSEVANKKRPHHKKWTLNNP